MKRTIKNKKGLELPLNVLVVITIALLVLVLVITLVLGGFSGLTKFLGVTTPAGEETLRTRCNIDLTSYIGQYGRTTAGPLTMKNKLCDDRTETGLDVNGDGAYDPNTDTFNCRDYVETSGIC